MQEQVEKTRQFMMKHDLPLDRSLMSSKTNKRLSTYLRKTAECMIRTAKHMEKVLRTEHDPRFLRTQLMLEELGETLLGLANCDEVETLDGLSDLAFVTIGTALAFDLPIVTGLDEVCDSNLTKKITDERVRDKGDDYVPPDMEQIMASHRGDRIE